MPCSRTAPITSAKSAVSRLANPVPSRRIRPLDRRSEADAQGARAGPEPRVALTDGQGDELLGPHWFLSPKVLLALVMAAFYAVTFHTRRFGLLRGPKLATLVFGGFVGLLGVYLVLGVMQLNNYFFWGASS